MKFLVCKNSGIRIRIIHAVFSFCMQNASKVHKSQGSERHLASSSAIHCESFPLSWRTHFGMTLRKTISQILISFIY